MRELDYLAQVPRVGGVCTRCIHFQRALLPQHFCPFTSWAIDRSIAVQLNRTLPFILEARKIEKVRACLCMHVCMYLLINI